MNSMNTAGSQHMVIRRNDPETSRYSVHDERVVVLRQRLYFIVMFCLSIRHYYFQLNVRVLIRGSESPR